jgi:hypothetical protein
VDTVESVNAAKAHALDRHPRACPEDPKGIDDYDWIVIVTGVPRAPGFGRWSAAKDEADD